VLPEGAYAVGKLVTGPLGDVTTADVDGHPYISVIQIAALERYTFPALSNNNDVDDATVGQFRGQRCNKYGEAIGDIKIFQMVYTEVHDIKDKGDAADADTDADESEISASSTASTAPRTIAVSRHSSKIAVSVPRFRLRLLRRQRLSRARSQYCMLIRLQNTTLAIRCNKMEGRVPDE
jgi:hypothetical protein